MLYQLPNGKVVNMTIEEYLTLTDLDIQYLLSINCGEHIANPFSGSIINDKKVEQDDEPEEESDEEEETYFEEYFPDEFDESQNLDIDLDL
jgi:hypothetical protein